MTSSRNTPPIPPSPSGPGRIAVDPTTGRRVVYPHTPPQSPGRPTPNAMPNSPAEALVPQRPPELPPQDDEDENDHPFLRMFDGLLNLIFVLLVAAVAMFYVLLVEFDRPGPLDVSTVFAVPKGASSRSIANRLTDEDHWTAASSWRASSISCI